MSFKLTGAVKVIKDTVQVTEKFSKREFVVTDASSMYPQDILFQAVNDRCDMLNGIAEGQQIEVSFNLRGREWNSPSGEVKYFNTLDAWRIEASSQEGNNQEANVPDLPISDDEDLPF